LGGGAGGSGKGGEEEGLFHDDSGCVLQVGIAVGGNARHCTPRCGVLWVFVVFRQKTPLKMGFCVAFEKMTRITAESVRHK